MYVRVQGGMEDYRQYIQLGGVKKMKILETLSNSDESLPFGAVSYHANYFFKIRSLTCAPTRFTFLNKKIKFKF